jgi:CRP-like cAMP-binding protein
MEGTNRRLQLLRMTKELHSSTDAELRALVPYFDEIAVPAGTRLAQEGRLSHQFFIVTEGELETCRQGTRGKLEAGDSFGWNAMYERGWDDATVTAASSARLLVMGHAQFRAVKAVVSEPAESSEPALSRSLAS